MILILQLNGLYINIPRPAKPDYQSSVSKTYHPLAGTKDRSPCDFRRTEGEELRPISACKDDPWLHSVLSLRDCRITKEEK